MTGERLFTHCNGVSGDGVMKADGREMHSTSTAQNSKKRCRKKFEKQPCSYFLPKAYQKHQGSADNECSVSKHSAVFSHHISEYIGQKKLTDNGKTITFGKRNDATFVFSSYQLTNTEFIQSQCRTFSARPDYDHSLYCCEDEICFMFRIRKNFESCTTIDVSCVNFDRCGNNIFHENIAVLEYKHQFNQYSCSLSDVERKIVVITGRDLDSYGTKLEMVDNYLDILTYTVNDCSMVSMQRVVRKNLTDACKLHDIDRIFFSLCTTKLILVFGKVFVAYSTTSDAFGSVLELSDDDKYHMTRYCFYVHDKYLGNLLIMCQSDGYMYTIREKNLVLELLEESSMYLSKLGFHNEWYLFMHIDYSDDILVYFTVDQELFILDYFQQCIVGKFMPPHLHYILDVKTNWSGEEVFVFLAADGIHENKQLSVLFIGKRKSLKDIAKLKVMQMFSRHQLKALQLPANLKLEMKVF